VEEENISLENNEKETIYYDQKWNFK
jgi:hypothetical protein